LEREWEKPSLEELIFSKEPEKVFEGGFV